MPSPRASATAPPPGLRPGPVARVRSWLVDWAVIGAWLAVLAVLGLVVRLVADLPEQTAPTTRELLVADLLITLGTVVPYVVYLSVSEASTWRATLGKRWAGLVVADEDGGVAGAGRVWLRNVVKAAPWQVAHLGVSRAIYEVQTPWALTLSILALLLGAACAVPALTGGRGLHDRVAGTRVERRDPDAAPGSWPSEARR